jgi:hypothetical protein
MGQHRCKCHTSVSKSKALMWCLKSALNSRSQSGFDTTVRNWSWSCWINSSRGAAKFHFKICKR